MWLGLSALTTAMAFALVKFFTTLHMRRLHERHMRLVYEIKRERTRARSLDGKLQVETSRRGAVEQKLTTARRFKDELYKRLRAELSENLQTDLRNCVHRHPVPDPAGVRVAHQLDLAQKVTSALDRLAVLVIELPATDADIIIGDLLRSLDEADLTYDYSGPTAETEAPLTITTVFDHPEEAMLFVQTAFGSRDEEQLTGVRGILMAGITADEFDHENINRLFARTLHSARTILDSAPEEGLLVNDKTREQLEEHGDLGLYSRAEGLWFMPWTPVSRDAVSQDGATAPADKEAS